MILTLQLSKAGSMIPLNSYPYSIVRASAKTEERSLRSAKVVAILAGAF